MKKILISLVLCLLASESVAAPPLRNKTRIRRLGKKMLPRKKTCDKKKPCGFCKKNDKKLKDLTKKHDKEKANFEKERERLKQEIENRTCPEPKVLAYDLKDAMDKYYGAMKEIQKNWPARVVNGYGDVLHFCRSHALQMYELFIGIFSALLQIPVSREGLFMTYPRRKCAQDVAKYIPSDTQQWFLENLYDKLMPDYRTQMNDGWVARAFARGNKHTGNIIARSWQKASYVASQSYPFIFRFCEKLCSDLKIDPAAFLSSKFSNKTAWETYIGQMNSCTKERKNWMNAYVCGDGYLSSFQLFFNGEKPLSENLYNYIPAYMMCQLSKDPDYEGEVKHYVDNVKYGKYPALPPEFDFDGPDKIKIK